MPNGTNSDATPDFESTFPERARALYDIARWRLDEQFGRIAELDRRVTAASSLNAIIVAIFGAAVALRGGDLPILLWSFAVVVLIIFFVSSLRAYQALNVWNWSIRPDLRDVQMLVGRDEGIQWYMSGNAIVRAYYENVSRIAAKERWTRWAIRLATLNAGVVSVAAIISSAPW